MKFGFAWSIKGIRPEARQNAQEAARRAGLSLSDWLNAVILQQAATQGIRPPYAHSNEETSTEDFSDVHHRLDDLTRRIDQVTRSGTAAYAPKRSREDTDQFTDLFSRLEQRFDQLANNVPRPPAAPPAHPLVLDRAVAEITARRRTLNGEAASAPIQQPISPAIKAPAAPARDVSSLEGQLQRITDQIETLRRPGVEEAIAALRAELGEIGRTLNEAMPRRAIEAIETQIQDLTQRIAQGRQSGADRGALAGIEHGLAEVRDALCELTPAENLIGYTEAIDALARKIDLIVAQRDPATMQQLEKSIGTLREMAAHVASNETVSGLSGQVQALADKIDHLAIGGGAGAALNKLELRIDALSRAMTDRAANGDGVSSRLEALLQSLAGKIDQLQQSRGDETALNHLEDRIAKLVERLDATNSRLNQLDAVERGVTDLLVHIEDIRAHKESTALRADSAPDIASLEQNMANTQDALEAVQDTLDRVADRITFIEKNIREDQPAAREPDILELTTPAEKTPAEPVAPPVDAVRLMPQVITPEPVSAPAPQPAQSLSSQFTNLGLGNRDLAGDQPIEPGFGRPNFGTHPAARIAASEADLGNALPTLAPAGGKSNFIAAARRAAQAAGQDPKGRQARPEAFKSSGGQNASMRNKMTTRVKSLFLAASIVAIIIGSIHYASKIFDFGIFDTIDAKFAAYPKADTANSDAALETTESETSALAEGQSAPLNTPAAAADADITASLLTPPTLPILTPATPQSVTPSTSLQPPLNLLEAAKGLSGPNSPPLNAPLLGAPPAARNDVTGSIARAPADARAARQPTMQPSGADGLPSAIGSARLRNAATSGDPAAAYEVGTRFMEGRGIPANLEEAARWYERAASKGLVPAQFRYASMLEKGQGVKKDLTAAHKLYVAAASKGHAKAMHNLAVIYAEGAEGKPDYANAAQWFRKAAEHGVADSQYNLGVLAARGLGIEKNIAEAYKWFALAAAQGDRDAGRKRDDLAAHLDAQTLTTIQEAVKNFVVQTQPAEAIVVPEPPGGWDRGTAASSEKPRPAGTAAAGAFNSGKL